MASLLIIALSVIAAGFVLAAVAGLRTPRAQRRYASNGDSSPMMYSGGGSDYGPGDSDCRSGDSGGSDGGCGDGGGGGGDGGGGGSD
jgi:hypothetical protein